MEDVCTRLDDLVVRYFETLAKVEEERERLQALLKEGYFRLSKARYSMGNKAVSSLQYDINNMKALATVFVRQSPSESECRFEVERKKPAKMKKWKSSSKEIHSSLPGSMDSPDSPEVRRRKGGADDQNSDEMPSIQLQDLNISDENDENTAPDPLTWFGVLVPSTLRQGQASFIQAVEVCCTLANLQSDLEKNRVEYRDLLEKKEKLSKQSSQTAETEETVTQ
ncbi:coiled-coil domain-containing protein 115-like [Ptychodera flava]|uniref:coiled-coil domain-containing protein 115-like n=1 Tax=Ptychodera flava TaxID=63121 RepID=UPI003969E3E5